MKELDLQLKSENNQLQNEINSHQNLIAEHQKDIAAQDRKMDRLKQQISDTKVKNEGAKTRLASVQKKVQELEIDLIQVAQPIDENKVELEIQALINKKKTLGTYQCPLSPAIPRSKGAIR